MLFNKLATKEAALREQEIIECGNVKIKVRR